MKKFFFAILFVIGAGILLMNVPSANALCIDPQGCYFDIPPSILSMTATPQTVITESSVSIDISGRRGGQYKDGTGFLGYNNVSLSGTIKDSSGVTKKSFSTSITSGGNDFNYNTSADVSSWSDGVYTVNATVCNDSCNSNSITFIIQRSPNECQTADGIEVCLSANKGWVYKGQGVDLTWSGTWISDQSDVDECHATEGPGFDTGGLANGTDASNSLTTIGTQAFSVTCTKEVYNIHLDDFITHTASASVNVEVINDPNNPQPSITITPSRLEGSGNVDLSWDGGSNSSECILTLGNTENGTYDGQYDGITGGFSFPAYAQNYNGSLHDANDGGSVGNITASIDCQNAIGIHGNGSVVSKIFHNYVYWRAKVKTACSDADSSATQMSNADEQQIRFDSKIVWPSGGISNYSDQTPNDPDNRAWGPVIPSPYAEFSVTGNVHDLGNNYIYCDNNGPVTVSQVSGYPPPQEKEVDLYFVQAGGVVPPAVSNLTAAGECHQNYPSTQTQVYLQWDAVNGAASYNVYVNDHVWPFSDTLLGNTTNTSFIDYPLGTNTTREYYVKAVNAQGEGDASSMASATTPSSCGTPPPKISDTLVLDPPTAQVCQSNTQQFNALYDPDGGGGARYGEFLVNDSANWSSLNPSIATSQGNGLFKGIAVGTATAQAIYRSLTATASLDVNACTQPDFNISINPTLRNVDITNGAGQTTYVVSLTSQSGFAGTIALSIQNLSNPMSGIFSPISVTLSDGQTKISTLTVNVPASTATGRSTFQAVGTSGSVSHSTNADINVTKSTTISATLTADPTQIQTGDSSTLSWSSLNAISCSIDQGIGQVCNSSGTCNAGGNEVVSPTDTTLYTLTCTGESSGPVTDQASVTVNDTPPTISANLSAYPTQIQTGESSTLAWSSIGATSCNIDQGIGQVCNSAGTCNAGGNEVVSPTDTTLYTLTCTGESSGPVTDQASVTVTDTPPPPPGGGGNPSCTLNVNPSTGPTPLDVGFDITASGGAGAPWQYMLDPADGSGDSGWQANSMFSYTYTDAGTFVPLGSVKDADGVIASCQSLVSASAGDQCTLSASPNAVLSGQSSMLYWSCTYPPGKTCTIDNGVGDVDPDGGSTSTGPLYNGTTYTLSCTGVPDSSANVGVGFLPVLREIIPH